tara:strand:- start:208 stop:855 length:648 start_codon:yes stop_codon:yes gene_type:complete
MSKKPLLSEGTARKWAKYAGIQNESKVLLSELYEGMEEEEEQTEGYEGDLDSDVLQELENMLAEEEDEDPMAADDEDPMAADDEDPMAADDMEDEEDELDAGEAAMMSQENVEAALKAGLEAMASAVADALKIKIDVRSGNEESELDDDVGEMDMDAGELDDDAGEMDMDASEEEVMEMADPMEEELYEGVNHDKLVEKVMKRVVARLVKKSKNK